LFGNCFHETSRYLADQNLTSNKQESSAKVCSVRSPIIFRSITPGKSNRTLNSCRTHYFRASGLADIVEHLKLFRSFLENVSGSGEFPLSPAINWKIVPEQGHSVVTLLYLGA